MTADTIITPYGRGLRLPRYYSDDRYDYIIVVRLAVLRRATIEYKDWYTRVVFASAAL